MTVQVEHKNLTMQSEEAAKVTPPYLGSQGSQPLTIAPVQDEEADCATMQSPSGPSADVHHPRPAAVATSALHSPVPCFSPAQTAAAAAGAATATYSDAAPEKRMLIIEAEGS